MTGGRSYWLLPDFPHWPDAACKGLSPVLWDIDSKRWQWREGARICGTCPVQDACYTYAVDNKMDGVWGGVPLKGGKPTFGRGAPPII